MESGASPGRGSGKGKWREALEQPSGFLSSAGANIAQFQSPAGTWIPYLYTLIRDLLVSAYMSFYSVIALTSRHRRRDCCWEMTQHREYPWCS